MDEIKANKFVRLIGDNLNFMSNVADERVDHHKHMVHMFASSVLSIENHFHMLPQTPEITLNQLTVEDIVLQVCLFCLELSNNNHHRLIAEILSFPLIPNMYELLPQKGQQCLSRSSCLESWSFIVTLNNSRPKINAPHATIDNSKVLSFILQRIDTIDLVQSSVNITKHLLKL